MKDSTKLYIETELNGHIKVNMKKCENNGYDWFDYFVGKDITEGDLDYIHKLDCYEYEDDYDEEDDEYEDDYDEEDDDYEDEYELDECEYSLIQLKVARELYKNGGSPAKAKKAYLFLDPECDFSGDWSNDPGYEESYCLGGDCYLIVECEDADYILRVDSDFYETNSEFENAEFIVKFEE